ncbi:MAG: tetratricopeptide repeat protein [Motiliproteus sp.]
MRERSFVLFLLLTTLLMSPSYGQGLQVDDDGFVGTDVCGSCHTNEYQLWQQSHHAQAMLPAVPGNVLGDFDNIEFNHGETRVRFSREGETYQITAVGGDNKLRTYPVEYTFGFLPLQQYLIDIGDGKLQAFDVAWDSRAAEKGGQRWFKLLPDEETGPSSPLHWARQLQNWNSRCAECHSTGVTKGFNLSAHRYQTTVAEISVGCEACHGAGFDHLQRVNDKNFKVESATGLPTDFTSSRRFAFSGDKPTAIPTGQSTSAQINACGGCHARRQLIDELDPAQDFNDYARLRLLDEGLYYADGQIQDEVFVLGSFLQSKMHRAGVTCTDCHNAHTGKVKETGNGLCGQCHRADRFDTPEHHHHREASSGAACVSCHMPATTYMEVDDRRDHSFSIPRPQQAEQTGAPDACTGCHQGVTQAWAASALKRWSALDPDAFSAANAKAQKADPLALRRIVELINNPEIAPIRRATLMTLAGNIPSRLTAETLSQQLGAHEPLVRAAAVQSAQFIPLPQRWRLLKPLINDSSAAVRYQVANQLAGYKIQLAGTEQEMLEVLLKEYQQQLKRSEDTPAGQLALANYRLNLGKVDRAEQALKQALVLEPSYIPALLNLADFYRASGNAKRAGEVLEQAVLMVPDSGAALHSLGLYWIRQGDLSRAVGYLERAIEQPDNTVRFGFIYAVALESTGALEQAIDVLKRVNQTWPHQYDVLSTLIAYLDKAGRSHETWPYLSRLSAIAPADPEVRRRLAAQQKSSSE